MSNVILVTHYIDARGTIIDTQRGGSIATRSHVNRPNAARWVYQGYDCSY